MLRFANASLDKTISATDITKGGGIGWRLNPFPNVRTDPCDYNVTLHDGEKRKGRSGVGCWGLGEKRRVRKSLANRAVHGKCV